MLYLVSEGSIFTHYQSKCLKATAPNVSDVRVKKYTTKNKPVKLLRTTTSFL